MTNKIILIYLIFISLDLEFINSFPITKNEKSNRQRRLILGVPCSHVKHTGSCIEKKIDTSKLKDILNMSESTNTYELQPFVAPEKTAPDASVSFWIDGLLRFWG
ncbi:uncharacterized protein LOC119612077 [Lucilia sericata]|uniref:uncharacterized protein LOC119612077 n=1 Tax=Lucilia sericata TaxID=13632 RepID=UPI0018A8532E|nr:uncharacterized protein LOC119612077 [Lucilia sericata]